MLERSYWEEIVKCRDYVFLFEVGKVEKFQKLDRNKKSGVRKEEVRYLQLRIIIFGIYRVYNIVKNFVIINYG